MLRIEVGFVFLALLIALIELLQRTRAVLDRIPGGTHEHSVDRVLMVSGCNTAL